MPLPLDLAEVIANELQRGRREHDGLLHASSDLIGSLRHSHLSVAGAPTIESEFVSDVRLHTGTMWHRYIQDALVKLGLPFMQEVNITPWMPKGWGGTLDLLIWNPEYRAFVLRDIKTIKGEGLRWIRKDGAKEDHVWQGSVYWHAAARAGFPLAKEVGIFYLPMNDVRGEDIYPEEITFEPLPWTTVRPKLVERAASAEKYLESLPLWEDTGEPRPLSHYLTDALAPVQERALTPKYDKKASKWELKLIPHWSTAYCPYPDELCDCNTQGVTKVGEWWDAGVYSPRKEYADIQPPPYPGA